MTTRREFLTQAGVITAAAATFTIPATPTANGAIAVKCPYRADIDRCVDNRKYANVTEIVAEITGDNKDLIFELSGQARLWSPLQEAGRLNWYTFDPVSLGRNIFTLDPEFTCFEVDPESGNYKLSMFPYPISYLERIPRKPGTGWKFKYFSAMGGDSTLHNRILPYFHLAGKEKFYGGLHFFLFSEAGANTIEAIDRMSRAKGVWVHNNGECLALSKPMTIAEIDQKMIPVFDRYRKEPYEPSISDFAV
jgi:hypothetical protein